MKEVGVNNGMKQMIQNGLWKKEKTIWQKINGVKNGLKSIGTSKQKIKKLCDAKSGVRVAKNKNSGKKNGVRNIDKGNLRNGQTKLQLIW